jgi:hypothetical protein
MPSSRPGPIQIQLVIPRDGLPAPSTANWFHFAHSGGEVQMMMGYVDPLTAAKAVEEASTQKVPVRLSPEVTYRLLLTPTGFLRLRAQVEEMFSKMRDAEQANEEPTPSTPPE